MVSYLDFLVTDTFDDYEDEAKFTKEFLPKLEKYRADLAAGILPEFATELPAPIAELEDQQLNSIKYLRDNKLLTEKEFEITDSTLAKLTEKIAKSEWSAVDVFKAFAKRGTIAHQFTNCALELFPEEGLERAKYLDEYLAKNGKTVGPLHGVPISLKEQMNYKNKITHGGYVSKITNISPKHSITTQILENLGAVFYVRTNQPQTLMHLCGNNNFIGHSRSPYNLALTSGGSSSGEGAIVAFGGSAVGIGSDIGGSIRAPAAFGGCFGLRPTTNRFSKNGGISSGAGQESVPAVQGPMTRSIDDIDFLMDVYINQGKPWITDCTTYPLPWKKVEKPKAETLTVAIMYDDGIVKPTPPVIRGLKHVAKALEEAGAKVVEFKPIKSELAIDTVSKMYCCDGNHMQRVLLAGSGEPLKKLTKWALSYGHGSKMYTVAENRQLNIIRDQLKQEYTDWMNDNKVDFIISPVYNNVAPRPEEVYNWSYTALFNLIDFPTLTVQTGLFQDPSIDKWGDDHASYEFRSPLEELEHASYDPNKFVGAPIAFQLTGRRYFDEDVVAAGKTIVDLLGVDLLNLYK